MRIIVAMHTRLAKYCKVALASSLGCKPAMQRQPSNGSSSIYGYSTVCSMYSSSRATVHCTGQIELDYSRLGSTDRLDYRRAIIELERELDYGTVATVALELYRSYDTVATVRLDCSTVELLVALSYL